MYDFIKEKGEYYDLVLTKDGSAFKRDLSKNRLFYVDVTQELCSSVGAKAGSDILVENITLNGYDNFFISNGNGTINPDVELEIKKEDRFCLSPVSGYTTELKYEITRDDGFNKLDGGFYQGFFKLYGYPIEFFKNRFEKGWTVNMLIHTPFSGTTVTPTLNDIFDNSGFVFYLGTRAENKFSDLSTIEVQILEESFSFSFVDTNNLYTNTGAYQLNDIEYIGYYYTLDGIPYAGRTIDDESQGNQRLYYNNKYKDLINNAFGVRILPDGRVGYRTVYATDLCTTEPIQAVSGITSDSFIDYTKDYNNFTVGKIITKYFTIEESYTKYAVINKSGEEYLYLNIIFERDFDYKGRCQLKYGDYLNGTLSILINGFTVYKNKNFKEVIPHELDATSNLQEGVPFTLSFGGGTQGLIEALYLDENKLVSDTLSEFFAGSFTGGAVFIEMYGIPLNVTEIRTIMKKDLVSYDLYYPQGGRRVYIKSPTPIIYIDIYSLYATTESITALSKIDFRQIMIGESKQIDLAGELSGFKQIFDVPVTYNLMSVFYFNYVTNLWESEDKIDDFDVTDFWRDTVQYKRYTHNKSNRGQTLIKLQF